MILNKQQEEGLNIVLKRYKEGCRYSVISGYAGAGKSTLIKFIISALVAEGVDPEQVVFTSFTGKACNVLQKKGNKNVSTLHKLLYIHFPRADGSFFRKPVPIGELGYSIVVVDEVSMVPKELMYQLFRHPVYVICCGDPFQLPPVDKNSDNHLLDNPHIFLDQIMRQAKESEIIRLSMDIRDHKPITNYSGNEVIIMPHKELTTGHLEWADQILVGTNATRVAINNQMRQLLGRGESPEDGDKIICGRNYWDIVSDTEASLVNGTIGYLKNSFTSFIQLPRQFNNKQIPVLYGDFHSDGNEYYRNLMMDKNMILTGESCLDYKQKYVLDKMNPTLIPIEFLYGYAITTHRAQGSEWSKVLVVEEKFPFDKEEHARWLYTACTRASDRLVLVRKD